MYSICLPFTTSLSLFLLIVFIFFTEIFSIAIWIFFVCNLGRPFFFFYLVFISKLSIIFVFYSSFAYNQTKVVFVFLFLNSVSLQLLLRIIISIALILSSIPLLIIHVSEPYNKQLSIIVLKIWGFGLFVISSLLFFSFLFYLLFLFQLILYLSKLPPRICICLFALWRRCQFLDLLRCFEWPAFVSYRS